MIITNLNNKVGLSLGNVGRNFECAIIVEQGQREDAILACIVVTDTSDVRLSEDKCRASWRIFVDSRHVTVSVEMK